MKPFTTVFYRLSANLCFHPYPAKEHDYRQSVKIHDRFITASCIKKKLPGVKTTIDQFYGRMTGDIRFFCRPVMKPSFGNPLPGMNFAAKTHSFRKRNKKHLSSQPLS
jgi:hypothetical protein